MNLQDKVVLVTGSSMGIGAEIARSLVRQGCKVVFAARSLDKLEAAAREAGPNALAVELDVTREDSVQRAMSIIETTFGRLDVLVNNAGNGGNMNRWSDSSSQASQAMFEVHVLGTERMMRAALPLFLRQGGGTIVNFTSTLGYVAMPGTAAYNAAKAAVIMLSRTLRAELRAQHIDVRLFGPPHTNTESGQAMPLNLPKIFEPAWVAEAFVHFLKSRRAESLAGGNQSLLWLQRISPALAGGIMEKIGFGALERVRAKQLSPAATPLP